ncbi:MULTISPECIES: translation initiation factor IF-2 [unclassified Psychrobacter]|uniref:translation initiation factor IF-2 n=1 Tax=unclassified Psychrobacter TaxID=196806 RepID=UPI000C34A9DD|nr:MULTISPECIES: translation initiation factor IF-2 [unclassified Psychrobacter]MBA6244972.1 translation initiation factor IF-2 [Psychrobacter sp. Urea-trap-18]MBA6286517.1 translation initiation factor IF-2 [Psychrobacter sp. Urea-trap-16]MBA6318528.1 translation initiation factor IF-2 [Psychrobacter sp. Urea-trap-20]MBA6334749.1 translation initiation factor IF-2 [Psychrobacter sp. Urea-trap-19]PKG61381.1 translation initiation factor IF-2 [Psychrobacter sp. Choline-3u-12]
MADKTVKELAEMVGKTTDAVKQQLVDAGLPARAEDDLVTELEQEKLVTYLKQSHGQQEKRRISLKSKTTSTARVTGSSGKSKSVNVEVRKKKVFEKPDPEKMAEELAAREQALVESQERAAKEAEERAATKKKAEERQAATLAAMRASLGSSKKSDDKNDDISTSVVVKKGGKATAEVKPKEQPKKKVAATKPKVETAAERKARETREKEEARLREIELETRRTQAEEAQKRTLEQMRKMAGKYTDREPVTEVRKDEPLAEGLVGDALEESFEKERREIKRGANSTGTRGRRRKNQDEREIKNRKNGLRSTQASQHKFEKPVEKIVYDVEISEQISVADLAQRMAVKAREVTKLLMKMGEMARESDTIDQATASLLVEEMGHNPVPVSDTKVEDDLQYAVDERSSNIQTRPPVVTIMGHVDHGKTSLLDKIRETKVANGEAGGITQHIGAYHVKTERGVITFLDTPGHAAFSAMRSRGAQATDIVVLVVAADDGMMPQTAEAIDHARAAGTPIIVAINKMDKPGADPDRVLNELTTKEVVSEEWGGDTPMARISAKTGEGIEDLLEFISLQAELMELEAPLDGAAQGVVIESRLEKGRGPVVSVLVKKGTLKQGDLVLAGEHYGKVRALTDEHGQRIKSAGPSIPVEILGLPETPAAGSEFLVVTDEKKAREVADFRTNRERERQLERQNAMRLESMFDQMGQGDVSFLNIVLKTDVRGSLEALLAALNELSTDEVKVRVISSGVGPISESDVTLAESSEAVLLGFNVRADATARRKADTANMDIRYYSVIYGLIDDVKSAMSGMLAPEHREKILGVADVREVFRSSKFGAAAGCMVVEGTIYRNKPIRVLRDDQVIFTGQLQSLRRYKEDVNEVRTGMECGLAVRGYDVEAGDKIEVFEIQEFARTI